jgi:hypothetical protein
MSDDEEHDDYDDSDEPCDHDGHDVDILTGRAHCWRCGGEAWWLSSDQLRHELELHAMLCEAAGDAP